jgi:hypothetical protein
MVNQKSSSLSTSRTDPELEVHSVDDDKMYIKPGMPLQGKKALLPLINGVPSTSTIKINDNTKSSTCDNGLSVGGIEGKTSRCNEYGYDVTDSEDCGDSKVDLGYHFTWSDEDEPSFLDQQGFGLNVYESIRAISKEASKKIDAVLAVDHVDQLQEELRKLRSEVKRRNDEYSDLKGIVHMKDHQIGTLELERDLYKADTTKLANDLETCLLKLRCVVGPSLPESGCKGITHTTEKEMEEDIESQVSDQSKPPERKELVDESDNNDRPVPAILSTHSLKPKIQNVTIQTVSSFSPATPTDTASTTSNLSFNTAQVSTPPRLTTVLPATPTEEERPASCPKQVANMLVPNISDDVPSPQHRRKNGLLFALCRGGSGNNVKKKVNSSVKTKSMGVCDSTSSPQSIISLVTAATDKNLITPEPLHRPHGILHSQIEDMDQRLHSSMKASEDLRRRVAMLHLYYENNDIHFDRSLVDKQEMQLSRTVPESRIEPPHSSTSSDLGPKSHRPTQDVQSLRKLRVVTFNL